MRFGLICLAAALLTAASAPPIAGSPSLQANYQTRGRGPDSVDQIKARVRQRRARRRLLRSRDTGNPGLPGG